MIKCFGLDIRALRISALGMVLVLLLFGSVSGQSIVTVAGNGNFGFAGDGGASTDASLADPAGLFVDDQGNVYIADTNNRRIRLVDTSGNITTLAGNGSSGFSGDGGPAINAALADPTGIAKDGSGNVYIADTNNHRIRMIDSFGTITTVAGDGNAGFSGDGGSASDARLNFPTGIYVSPAGNIYFADRENHRVRMVDGSGVISTLAGTGSFGYSGDGGTATSANLAFPAGVSGDTQGNIYIADRFNYRIRMVDVSGNISTVAGNGSFGFSGDGGAATLASLAFPSGIAVDASGSLYIADRDNSRVRRVDNSGIITTIAGNGIPGFSGDEGAAVGASLNRPAGVYGDTQGNVYIADTSNRRVRKVAAPARESSQATGLTGVTALSPGTQIQVLNVGITGDGTSSLNAITVTLADLSSPTGLAQSDFFQLQIHRSLDNVLDGGDTQIGVYGQESIQIGSPVTLVLGSPSVPPSGTEWFYIVSAEMNTQVTDGHGFTVGFPAGGVTTSSGSIGTAVTGNDADRATVDVVATQLVFTVQPAGSVNGTELSLQPVVTAMDLNGNVDLGFADPVTLGESASGSLQNNTVTPVGGVATFTNLIYDATTGQEVFALVADDVSGGTEGDLPAVTSSSVVCDVVATQIVFGIQPAGSVSGDPLASQPAVVAQDASGLVDTGFNEVVTLTEGSPGSLSGHTQVAVAGVATFSDVNYSATADGESFSLTADDQVGGVEGDLPYVTSASLISDVVGTLLVFAAQPSGSLSGQRLTSQPMIVAQDGNGLVDVDFSDTVTLATSAAGTLSGNSVAAVLGIAAFADVTYTATVDHESFSLTADDEITGVEGNLSPVVSGGVTSNVLATRLVFVVQPAGSSNGQSLGTQPVVAAQDADGLVDVDFAETIQLAVNGPGALTNAVKAAVGGIATYNNLTYTPTGDHESFVLAADDQDGGLEGNLSSVTSTAVISDIVATQLIFLIHPGASVSGQVMGIQPLVVAQNGGGVVDVDFTETVTLQISGGGSLTGASVSAVEGVAAFTQLTHLVSADHESFALIANDEPTGVEGDLPAVSSNATTSDAVATQLVFAVQPAGSINGQILATQPVVAAQNVDGITDVDFSENITITVQGDGSISNKVKPAVGGVATFTSLIYSPVGDNELFTLSADDLLGGVEGDLPAVVSNPVLSDIVASKLVFIIQPEGSVSGAPLTTQPVVVAQTPGGALDVDFTDTITLTTTASGTLSGQSVAAVDGVALFTDLSFRATADGESLVLSANDESTGPEGDLPPIDSNSLTSNVVGTQLLFLIQPGGSTSGHPLGVQPVLVSRDADGLVDTDFSDLVSLTAQGLGTVSNNTVSPVSGVATFASLTYTATSDGEPFTLTADDLPGGEEGDLGTSTSVVLVSDVKAEQLVFEVQPQGIISGEVFLTTVMVQGQDNRGVLDIDFSDLVTLSTTASGTLKFNATTAVDGVASFPALYYTSATEMEVFMLAADDEAGGLEGDLPTTLSSPITSGAGAPDRLGIVFDPDPIPANAQSVKEVGVQVLDASGNVRLSDNSTEVSLLVAGEGSGGGTAIVIAGTAVFPVASTSMPGEVTFTASAPDLVPATGSFITVAGVAALLEMSYDTGGMADNGEYSREVTINVVDMFGNLAVDDHTTLIQLFVSGAGTGTDTATVSNGTHTFLLTSGVTPGLLWFNASSSGLTGAEGSLAVGVVPPDLVVSSDPVGPSEVFREETYTISFDVGNIGDGPVIDPFVAEVYLVGANDSLKMGNGTIDRLVQVDSTVSAEVSFKLPSFSFVSLSQAFRWVVKLDVEGDVDESDEENNDRGGNLVGIPLIAISQDSVLFETVVLSETGVRTLNVSNTGLAPLSFSFVMPDSHLSVFPDSVSELSPGETRTVALSYTPLDGEPLAGWVRVLSNDPKGDILFEVQGGIAIPERVFMDLDPAPGNQELTLTESDQSQEIPVELYVTELPTVQAVKVQLQFDTRLITYIPDSWKPGSFINGTVLIQEEEELKPGLIELGLGTLSGGSGAGAGYLGRLMMRTTGQFPSEETANGTVIRAVHVWYLTADGKQHGIHVLAKAQIDPKGEKWPDLDGNGKVEFVDYLIFLRAFKQNDTGPGWHEELPNMPYPQTPYKRFDLDDDGRIGFYDFLTFAQDYRDALEAQNVGK